MQYVKLKWPSKAVFIFSHCHKLIQTQQFKEHPFIIQCSWSEVYASLSA